jgi:hypothetical protein
MTTNPLNIKPLGSTRPGAMDPYSQNFWRQPVGNQLGTTRQHSTVRTPMNSSVLGFVASSLSRSCGLCLKKQSELSP